MSKDATSTLELNAVDNVTGVIKQVSGSVEGLTKKYEQLKNVALLGVTGLTGAAIAGMIRDTIALQAEVGRLAERAGTSAEALSSLMSVAKLSHTDLETVATAMAKLSRSMVEAESGTGKAGRVFEALGINLRDNAGNLRAAQDVMQEFGQQLLEMKDKTLAVAFAQEVLGKNGATLIPFLYELGRAGELHAKFTDEEAAAAKELEDNLVRLEAGMGKLKLAIANYLVPGMVSLTENLVEAKDSGGGFLQVLMEIGKVIAAIMARMPGLGTAGDKLAEYFFQADEERRRQREEQRGPGRAGAAPGTRDVANPFAAGGGAGDPLAWTPQQEEMFQARKHAWQESDKITADRIKAEEQEAAALQRLSDQQDKEAKHYLDILDPARAYIETQEKLYALLAAGKLTLEETLAIQRKLFEAKNGVKDLGETASVAAEAGHQMGLSFTSSLERVVFDSGRAVKAMDLLKAAAMDVAKVIYGRNVAEPLAGATQSVVTGIMNSLGGSSAYVSGTMTAESAGMLGQMFHGGGMVGIDGVSRYVHPAYFEGAPRFHDGLAPDEFPAILQKGEGVFTSAQMKAMGGGTMYIDARGADRAGMARLTAMVQNMGASIRHQAMDEQKKQNFRRAISG